MNSSNSTDDFLERAIQRAARSCAPVIATLIAVWQNAFPEEDVRKVLACDRHTVSGLSLCLRPRGDQWLEDVNQIAEDLVIDPDLLIPFLRSAEAVERFGIAHPFDDAQAGRLLAARDHDKKEL